jgi:hypothetical protein
MQLTVALVGSDLPSRRMVKDIRGKKKGEASLSFITVDRD